jgi:acetolactate synthase-1/2/3 large subunit
LGGPRYLDLMHETLAVAMATGYGLATGRPQLVLLHTVPGLLQGACGIHGALLSGAGMIVASSESITYGETDVDPGSQWYRNLSIVGGPQAVAQPFTKWSSQVGSVSNLYQMVLRASELARRGPAGPVYLNVPVEVLLEPWTPPSGVGRAPALPGGRVSTDADLQQAARRLLDAERPVLITESVGRHPDGFEALVELAELLAIPVVEPQSAVCSNFPRTSPLHQGGNASPLTAEADLIVLACTRAPWYPPSNRPGNAEILVIDDVPHRPYVDYQVLSADQYLEGDVGPTLRALTATVKALGVETRSAPNPVALPEPSGKLDAAAVTTALKELLDPDAAVVDETITHSRVVAQHLQADRPGRYSYVQGGLGQGIGVALGMKLASPGREVALTIGDGSFLYNPIVQSLAASKQLGLPVLIVVYNNHKYLSMQLNHLRFYPDGAAVGTENFLGVDLTEQPPLSELVAPFGMPGEKVTSLEELKPALERALASVRNGVTALVDVSVTR